MARARCPAFVPSSPGRIVVPYGVIPVAQTQLPLARRFVRYRGEPVAAVAAVDDVTARAALAAIELDIAPLPASFDATPTRRCCTRTSPATSSARSITTSATSTPASARDLVREERFHYAEVRDDGAQRVARGVRR